MPLACPHRPLHRLCVAVAAFFGLATIFAGGTVLVGWRDPGYEVVPLVLGFNVIMGFVYLGVAVLIARDLDRGRLAVMAITVANLLMLGIVITRRLTGAVVADETLLAMSARFVVWAAIVGVLTYEKRAFSAPAS